MQFYLKSAVTGLVIVLTGLVLFVFSSVPLMLIFPVAGTAALAVHFLWRPIYVAPDITLEEARSSHPGHFAIHNFSLMMFVAIIVIQVVIALST